MIHLIALIFVAGHFDHTVTRTFTDMQSCHNAQAIYGWWNDAGTEVVGHWAETKTDIVATCSRSK